MDHIRDKATIEKQAVRISNMICNVNTNYRGNLFEMISKNLRRDGQWYTASLFENISENYGVDKELN